MSFVNLPRGWAERPIADPDVFAGAVDLLASAASRAEGCLYLLACDDRGRLAAPTGVAGWRFADPPLDQARRLAVLCDEIASLGTRRIAAIAARPGLPQPSGEDQVFFTVLSSVAARFELTVDGVAIATPGGVLAAPGECRLAAGQGRLSA